MQSHIFKCKCGIKDSCIFYATVPHWVRKSNTLPIESWPSFMIFLPHWMYTGNMYKSFCSILLGLLKYSVWGSSTAIGKWRFSWGYHAMMVTCGCSGCPRSVYLLALPTKKIEKQLLSPWPAKPDHAQVNITYWLHSIPCTTEELSGKHNSNHDLLLPKPWDIIKWCLF